MISMGSAIAATLGLVGTFVSIAWATHIDQPHKGAAQITDIQRLDGRLDSIEDKIDKILLQTRR